ncbi:MAG: co-chaperone GroES [Vicinamibacterales bacterium]
MSAAVAPVHDRLVVKLDEKQGERKSEGGLFIPVTVTSKEKPQTGEVLAAGPGRYTDAGALIPMSVKAGQRILFGKYSGSEIELDGQKVLVIRDSDVMGLLPE